MPTIETIGPSGCDYTTPQAWFDAHAGDITGDTNAPYIGEIEAGEYAGLSMTGATTDATHYFHLRAAAGQEFRGNFNGAYPRIASIYCAAAYTRLEYVVADAYSTLLRRCLTLEAAGCVAHGCGVGNPGGPISMLRSEAEKLVGIYLGAGATARCCVVAGLEILSDTDGTLVGIEAVGHPSNGDACVYHCSVHALQIYDDYSTPAGTAVGIMAAAMSAGVETVRNCAVGDLLAATTACILAEGGAAADIDYNATTDSTGGTHGQSGIDPAVEFADVALPYYSLRRGAAAVALPDNAGSLAGYANAPTVDIDGEPIGPDIGCETQAGVPLGWLVPLCPIPPPPAEICREMYAGTLEPTAWSLPDATVGMDWFTVAPLPIYLPPRLGLRMPALAEPPPALLRTKLYVDARGLYRVFHAAEYRIYRSQAGPPAEGDTPAASSASLPATPALAWADGVWYVSLSYFDGVLDSGFFPVGPRGETYLRLEIASGAAVSNPPAAPLAAWLEARAGGVVRVHALYLEADTTLRADEWAIAYTTDGSDPPEDTADATATIQAAAGLLDVLQYDLPAAAHGATVKVRVQVRRGSDEAGWTYSDGSTVLSVTADAAGPAAPETATAWPGSVPSDE